MHISIYKKCILGIITATSIVNLQIKLASSWFHRQICVCVSWLQYITGWSLLLLFKNISSQPLESYILWCKNFASKQPTISSILWELGNQQCIKFYKKLWHYIFGTTYCTLQSYANLLLEFLIEQWDTTLKNWIVLAFLGKAKRQ